MHTTPPITYTLRKLLRPLVVPLDGFKVHVPRSLPPGVRKAIYKGTYELEERRLVTSALRSGDRVLELGCGTGIVGLVCAGIVGTDNLLSYEANPLMYEIIAANFALNGLNANLVNRAVSLRGGDITFFQNANLLSSSLFPRRAGNAITVASDPLDAVIGSYRPTALVMDIEGAEADLLSQADLSGIGKIILEVHPGIIGQDATRALLDHLEKSGLSCAAQSASGDVVYLSRQGTSA